MAPNVQKEQFPLFTENFDWFCNTTNNIIRKKQKKKLDKRPCKILVSNGGHSVDK